MFDQLGSNIGPSSQGEIYAEYKGLLQQPYSEHTVNSRKPAFYGAQAETYTEIDIKRKESNAFLNIFFLFLNIFLYEN